MRVSINLPFSRRFTLIALAVVLMAVAAGSTWHFLRKPSATDKHATIIYGNPIPSGVSRQLGFKAVYPKDITTIDTSSFNYVPQQKTLSFNVADAKNTIVFTEQPAPSSLGSGNQIYYQAIGLHPYAQFESNLGPVALAKFFQTGSLTAAGESAVLDSHGTLVIAHTNALIGNDDWKNLFNRLKLSQ